MAKRRHASKRSRALCRASVASFGLILAHSPSTLNAQSQSSDTEPVRSLDQRFSEEIGGVQDDALYDTNVDLRTASFAVGGDSSGAKRARGVFAKLTAGWVYDDNVLRIGRRGESDDRFRIAPTIGYEQDFGQHRAKVSYEGEYNSYWSMSDENTADHKLQFEGDFTLHKKLKALLRSRYEVSNEKRGDRIGRVQRDAVPDSREDISFAGDLTLGRRIAIAQVRARGEYTQTRYTNNNQGVRDIDVWGSGLTGFYNFGPKLSAFIEGNYTILGYRSGLNLDGWEKSVFAGVRWEATAKTQGEFKIGRRKRSFADKNIDSVLGTSWDLKVLWEPRANNQVQFFSMQTGEESAENGGAQQNRQFGALWDFAFDERWSMTSEVTIDFTSASPDTSGSDTTITAGTMFTYEIDRGLAVQAGVRRTVRESADRQNDFKNHTLSLEFVAEYPQLSSE